MNPNGYSFEVIDADGFCKPVAEMHMMAIFNKVTEISEAIAKPGHRIRVKDQNGDAVFVGGMTRQGADDQDSRVRCAPQNSSSTD